MINKIVFGILTVLLIIQFFKPERNLSDNQTSHISTKYKVPDDVNQILQIACNDCHSNKTNYPWYANLQPAAWMLRSHVVEGKEHLNFSEFTNMSIAKQNHMLEEVIEEVNQKEMPLESYTYFGLHNEANLTDEQCLILTSWARSVIDTIKSTYPKDSLILKKRKKA